MNKLVVISSYPERGITHGQKTVGVASYAKNTIDSILKINPKNTDITVIAEHLGNTDSYSTSNLHIKRLWKKDSFTVFFKIAKEIFNNHKKTKTVLIEFELSMFGKFYHLIPLPIFLLYLKFIQKKVVLVNHQVIPNFNEIATHIGVKEHSFYSLFFSFGLRIFYTSILLLCDRVIVFENELSKKLSRYGNRNKISVIPHGVEKFDSTVTKKAARKMLGLGENDFIITAFGYLAWYKGTDWLTQEMGKINPKTSSNKIKLIIAGGPNPNHTDKNFYINYLNTITKQAKKNDITITGFVDQKKIQYYYKAADVIVFPYRTYMSSSGPLSIAYSFNKPFLLSENLKSVLSQNDIKEEIYKLKLPEDMITFKLNTNDLRKSLLKIKKNKSIQRKLTQLSSRIAQKRSWQIIGKDYYEKLFI